MIDRVWAALEHTTYRPVKHFSAKDLALYLFKSVHLYAEIRAKGARDGKRGRRGRER
jgi:hypothetical protein